MTPSNDTSPWVCIDFGTCNTAAAILVDGRPQVVTYGNSTFFPTVACVLSDGSVQVCQNAEPLRERFPEFFKQEFKLDIASQININGRGYSDIVREILAFVKAAAEIQNNNNPLSKVLLTVPAIYTAADPRMDVMRRAAAEAGFEQVEFIPEPHAAAWHYADVCGVKNSGISLIYDLGGGTFDPVVLDLNDPANPRISGDGGVQCGGQFFDAALYKFISAPLRGTEMQLQREHRLADYMACRRIKEALSMQNSATQLFSNGKTITVTRQEFNSVIAPLLQLTFDACDAVVAQSGRHWAQMDRILFVGGSTAIPLISEKLQTHLASHNAAGVKLIRSRQFARGAYSHLHATCLGGIASKIGAAGNARIGAVLCNGRRIQLREGINTFGRSSDNNFSFDDPYMSRHHFTIEVQLQGAGEYSYSVSSRSESQPTLLNHSEALDKRYVPFCRDKAPMEDGAHLKAGKTEFILKLQ